MDTIATAACARCSLPKQTPPCMSKDRYKIDLSRTIQGGLREFCTSRKGCQDRKPLGKVTNLQEGARAMWSRIRKETGGAGLVADMQGLRGKRRKVSGVSRIGAKGVFPGAQEGRGPLVYPLFGGRKPQLREAESDRETPLRATCP
jgi:hypothetical protein